MLTAKNFIEHGFFDSQIGSHTPLLAAAQFGDSPSNEGYPAACCAGLFDGVHFRPTIRLFMAVFGRLFGRNPAL